MLPFDDLPLHVGDRLRIVCPDVPELCVERAVGTDGTIDLPLVGPVAAAVRRPSEVAYTIQSALPLEDCPHRLDVRFLGAAAEEVGVSGAVERPLRVYAPRGIGRDRLMAAAKPTKDADLGFIALPSKIRPGAALDLPSLTADRKIEVLGGVAAPQVLSPRDDLTLGGALESAGGLSGHGDAGSIVVVRRGEPIPLAVPANASFRLLPGDLVRVGLVSDRHYVVVKGKVRRPGSVEFSQGLTVTKALEAAGGAVDGIQGGVVVWQTGSKTFRLSLLFILDRRILDPILGPEDTIIVEAGKP